jgi:hypothetical protein
VFSAIKFAHIATIGPAESIFGSTTPVVIIISQKDAVVKFISIANRGSIAKDNGHFGF